VLGIKVTHDGAIGGLTVTYERITQLPFLGNLTLAMRWTLFNWLLDVASSLDLEDVVLPLTWSIIDAYLFQLDTFCKSQLHTLGKLSSSRGEGVVEHSLMRWVMDDIANKNFRHGVTLSGYKA